MRLVELAALLKQPCTADCALSGITIDSRLVKPGNVFVAIRGERLDGHRFIRDAVALGCAVVVCDHAMPDVNVVQWVVPDTVVALAAMAQWHRQHCSLPVIALTGSNGKTTVKEMIASILPAPSFATPGNLNNHLGAPLSVLQLKPHYRYAVFELGASHVGEIAHTVAVVQPQVTLINNIAPAHIEGFGTLDDVAKAKGEIHQGLAMGGCAIINDDDTYAHYWDTCLADKTVVRFSIEKPTAVHTRDLTYNKAGCAEFVLVTPEGEASITLRVPGKHNVSNALAAAACTQALGIALSVIASGLCEFTGVSGRMTARQGKNHAVIIDDTYNANLCSSLTALDVLASRPGMRVFVMGDMGELGALSHQHHHDLGIAARAHGIDCVMTCGTHSEATALAFGANGKHYDSQDDLVRDLRHQLSAETTVLVKGSRSAAMENVVHQLLV